MEVEVLTTLHHLILQYPHCDVGGVDLPGVECSCYSLHGVVELCSG